MRFFYDYYLCKVLNLYYLCQEQLSQFMVMLAQMPPYKSHLQCRFCQILFAEQLKGKKYLSDFNYIAHFCLVYSRYLSKFFSRKVHCLLPSLTRAQSALSQRRKRGASPFCFPPSHHPLHSHQSLFSRSVLCVRSKQRRLGTSQIAKLCAADFLSVFCVSLNSKFKIFVMEKASASSGFN